jgi:hypothetical protein
MADEEVQVADTEFFSLGRVGTGPRGQTVSNTNKLYVTYHSYQGILRACKQSDHKHTD